MKGIVKRKNEVKENYAPQKNNFEPIKAKKDSMPDPPYRNPGPIYVPDRKSEDI